MRHGSFSLMDCLDELEDPREACNGTLHDFRELLVIAICASFRGIDTCEDFSFWAEARQAWLKKFLTLKSGIPSSATFCRLFRALDPKKFEAFFRRWVNHIAPGQMAIEGKTVRGSTDGARRPAHIVSAFSTDRGIVFGQERVGQKSNEITAIPESLEALYVKGFLVRIDARACQKEIARKILDKDCDYLSVVKGNQSSLLEQVSAVFSTEFRAELPCFEDLDASHGRVVSQLTRAALATQAAIDSQERPQRKTAMVASLLRQANAKTSNLEQRYYISLRDFTPEAIAKAISEHRAVESMHPRIFDVNFSEDTHNMHSLKINSANARSASSPTGKESIIRSILGGQSL